MIAQHIKHLTKLPKIRAQEIAQAIRHSELRRSGRASSQRDSVLSEPRRELSRPTGVSPRSDARRWRMRLCCCDVGRICSVVQLFLLGSSRLAHQCTFEYLQSR